ncbi:hypothetical protein SC936_05110 [Aggregatibacter actinomycetemcomitans serotype e str. SC936]|nr:hypothetical protein SC936_05110 [Aggregatibacter actinomycetemcomitans serotype e str. SC936]
MSYGSGHKICGNSSKEVNFQTIDSDDTGLTIHHGFYDPNFFHDGYWQWDEQFIFSGSLKGVYRNALLPGLIKALKNDNCDIANAILDAMQNPNIVKNGDTEFLGFKNGEDRCAVLPDGKTLCKGPSYRLSKTKDGETRLHVDPNNPEWNKSLDDYAGTKQSENNNNPGTPGDNKGDGSGIHQHRGNGSSPDKKGEAEHGNNKPGQKGGDKKGDKPGNGGNGGSGVGNGKGDNDGDGEGKGLDDIKTPNLQTPDLERTLRAAKKGLDDRVGLGYELSAGQCEPITVPVFNRTQTIDVHCKIIDKMGATVSPVFTLLWSSLALIIILSA